MVHYPQTNLWINAVYKMMQKTYVSTYNGQNQMRRTKDAKTDIK